MDVPTASSGEADTPTAGDVKGDGRLKSLEEEASKTSLNLTSITAGQNERGIPEVTFIEDIGEFASSFTPPASAELLIGAFSDLFSKYKAYETSLSQKRLKFQEKLPEIEKSLTLVKYLKQKMESGDSVVTRYNLADTVYANAELDCNGTVNLWLGANVMLEYSYDEAIELLSSKEEVAKREYQEVIDDLAFTRNQIITSEVNISRIYNWDVRMKRAKKALEAGK